MATRPTLFTVTATVLLLAACRDQKVTSYRIPKEKDAQVAAATPEPAGAPNAPMMPGAAGANANMAATPVATAQGAGLVWTAPVTWRAKAGSAMRKGTYMIGDTGAEAELSITAFPGDVGGEVANVNRWRGQVSLPALPEAEVAGSVTRLSANGLAITIVDCAGANSQHLLGAIVPFQGATWFFKMMGPDAAVTKARADFVEFVKTLKAAP